MGKKIVCDRCGAEIKKKPSYMNLKFPAVVSCIAVKESLLCDFYEFDLCDDAGRMDPERKGERKCRTGLKGL